MDKTMNIGAFETLDNREMMEVDGGAVWEAATAVVVAAGAALVGGFNAGRQFVKDIRNKFF